MMHFTGISRANYSISRAFHGLLLEFHDVFTGFSSNNKHKQSSSRILESQALSDTGLRPTIPGQYCYCLVSLLLVIGYEGLGGRNENRVLSVIVPYF